MPPSKAFRPPKVGLVLLFAKSIKIERNLPADKDVSPCQKVKMHMVAWGQNYSRKNKSIQADWQKNLKRYPRAAGRLDTSASDETIIYTYVLHDVYLIIPPSWS